MIDREQVNHVRKAETVKSWMDEAKEKVRIGDVKRKKGLEFYRQAGEIFVKSKVRCKEEGYSWLAEVRRIEKSETTVNGYIDLFLYWDKLVNPFDLTDAKRQIVELKAKENKNDSDEEDDEGSDGEDGADKGKPRKVSPYTIKKDVAESILVDLGAYRDMAKRLEEGKTPTPKQIRVHANNIEKAITKGEE